MDFRVCCQFFLPVPLSVFSSLNRLVMFLGRVKILAFETLFVQADLVAFVQLCVMSSLQHFCWVILPVGDDTMLVMKISE